MSNVNIKENNNIVAKTKNLWLKYKEKNYITISFVGQTFIAYKFCAIVFSVFLLKRSYFV